MDSAGIIFLPLPEYSESKSQRGNALFLILIAVALFAALSYAITQTGRGGGTISQEQAEILASEVTDQAATLRTTVMRMVLTGTPVTSLDFTTPTTGQADQVFDPAGGDETYEKAPAGTGWPFWNYLDARDPTMGWYVLGVGTDTATTGREVLAILAMVPKTVCQQIDKGLGLSTTLAVNGVPFDATTPSASAAAPATAWTLDATPGQPFACIKNVGTINIYYHALVEQ